MDRQSVATFHVDHAHVFLGVEARREDDRVDLPLCPVAADDAPRRDLRDPVGDELDVRRVEGLEVLVRCKGTLGAEWVVGGELRAEPRVLDGLERLPSHLFGRLEEARLEIREGLLDDGEQVLPALLEEFRLRMERSDLIGRVRRVLLREHPVRRALEHVKARESRSDLRNELNRARGAADHGDAFPREVVLVIPVRGVEDRAFEAVEPRDVRNRDGPEHADGADHESRFDFTPVVEGELPARGRLVPPRGADAGSQSQVRLDAAVAGDPLEVRTDLFLGREGARPFKVRRERIAIEGRRDVALESRVGVALPRAAHARFAIEDQEVVLTPLEQLDAGAEAAGASADDRERRAEGVGHGGSSGASRRERVPAKEE